MDNSARTPLLLSAYGLAHRYTGGQRPLIACADVWDDRLCTGFEHVCHVPDVAHRRCLLVGRTVRSGVVCRSWLILLMQYETLLLVVRNAGRFSGTGSRPPLSRGARLRKPSGRPLRCWQAVSLVADQTRRWPGPGLRSVRGGPRCHTPRRHAALRLLPSPWIREA